MSRSQLIVADIDDLTEIQRLMRDVRRKIAKLTQFAPMTGKFTNLHQVGVEIGRSYQKITAYKSELVEKYDYLLVGSERVRIYRSDLSQTDDAEADWHHVVLVAGKLARMESK